MKLPASVVKHLVKYYLDTAELSDVKEIRMDHLIKDVNEAWMDQKGKSLPSMHPPCYVESNLMLPHISGDSLRLHDAEGRLFSRDPPHSSRKTVCCTC